MARKAGRTQACGAREAQARLTRARRFLETAELLEGETDPDSMSVGAALAVLAGIAASDAACCKALGRRSRSDNHHDAERLLEEIARGGKKAANDLRRLINEKDDAQYGFFTISATELKRAIGQARSMITFAEDVLRRS